MQTIKQFLRQVGISNNCLERMCKSGYIKLKQAVQDNDTPKVLEFLRKGYPFAQNGENILQVAVLQGNLQMVKTVVDNFIELSLEDKTKEGDTPLMLAVLANNIEIAKYLLDSGSNINARENEGSTPLLAAAANGFVDLLIFLIDSGANIDSRNFQGQTALHRACFYGELAAVKFLVKNTPLRLSTCDKKGNNCVHLAAMGLSIRCIRYIMKKAKDQGIFEQRNQQSMTPHDILVMKFESIRDRQVPTISHSDIVKYLKHPDCPPPVTLEQFNNKPTSEMPKEEQDHSLRASEILEDFLNVQQSSLGAR